MPLLGRSSNSSKTQAALFDIRLKGIEHDVIVIKGAVNDASSVLLSGTIVLSVLEPMSIKKLSLKLYATLRLKWTNVYETQRGSHIKKPFRYERRVFEHNWDNFEIQNYFSNLYDNYNSSNAISSATKNNSASSSSTSLKSFGISKKSKSSSNLTSFGSSASLSQQNHILLQGNYEFPFSTILPGSTLESVEGLPGASLVYKLQANIERGRFANDLVAKRHLRIVRTLTPDAVELSETMAVDNTWPKKVEYSISIPSRAVPIGSASHISMLFVPLMKGLKLGKVKISLVEYYSCCGSYGPSHSGERKISEFEVPTINITQTEDRWEIETLIHIPPSLSKCTQDVDILTNVKVRHKLKFVVGLINPDGHVSELRASLPIILFVSPFVTVGVKNFDRSDSVGDNSLSAFAEIPSDGEKDGDAFEDDDVIFAADPEVTPQMVNNINSSTELNEESADLMAPPNYENHIYDRLWNEIPIEDTPEGSRAQTPGPGTPNGLGTSTNDNSVDNSNGLGKLTENLRKLHLQRLNEQSAVSLDSLAQSSTSPPTSTTPHAIRPSFTLGDEEDEEDGDEEPTPSLNSATATGRPMFLPTPTNEVGAQDNDYFSLNPHRAAIISPGGTPGFNHLSRVNSREQLTSPSLTPQKDWDAESMSRVPSYQQAMRSPTFDDFSPAYVPPADDISRPRSIHLKPSSLSNSRHESTSYLSNLRGGESSFSLEMGSGSLRTTSPTLSRTGSSSNVTTQSTLNFSKSPVRSKLLGGMTPLSGSPPIRSESKSNLSSSFAEQQSIGSHSRSSSFVNLMGNLMHKKPTAKPSK